MGRLSARPWRNLRWLVLAPHPDDEVLGAGALIVQAVKAGCFAGLVFLTDGSGSHPVSGGRLAQVRKREARHALFRLAGQNAGRPVHLGWKDAHPFGHGEAGFERARRSLMSLCARWRVDAIAVTARDEPHCDHAASAALAYAVKDGSRRPVLVAEYLVWGVAPGHHRYRQLSTDPMPQGLRRNALSAHRSQLTASHGPGFRLARERLRMPARDTLYIGRHS